MQKIEISEKEYCDKVLACWLGKNIGGTLGAPYEGIESVFTLEFYERVPKKAAPNDDLDLQLIWLKMLEDVGPNPSLQDFAAYWKRYAINFPWNEYGFLRRNLLRGLLPPIAGCFENYFVDEMGSPIRSEIWACVAPGDPQLAASMAWRDSVLDHAGGEGMYGEMFWAAVESAAFVIEDPKTLIQIGLNMIPMHSAISRAIREVLWCYENKIPCAKARERVLIYFGHKEPCHAPQNHGFTILGWLYGNDFGDKLCKAVNCGYDTDCTGATLGALLGILGGTAGIPQKWRAPIGDQIVLHRYTQKGGFTYAPKTIFELTDRTLQVTKRFLQEKSDAAILTQTNKRPDNVISLLFRNEKALMALKADTQAAVVKAGNIEITLHYWGDPVIRPRISKLLGISLKENDKEIEADINLEAREGWKVNPIIGLMGQKRFIVTALDIQNQNVITVHIALGNANYSTQYTILGPEAAQGYPSGGQAK